MNHTDAELIETHEHRPSFTEAWIIDHDGPFGRDQNPDLYFDRETAERCAAEHCKTNYRILRLPSERDSARSALVAELHRAAVELAEADCAISDNDIAVMCSELSMPEADLIANRGRAEQKYRACKAAIAAFDAKEKQS